MKQNTKAEIHQINEGIEQINDVVQTNSATSEECAAASEEMSSEADNLRTMIRRFKVATIIPFSTAFTERSISAADSFAASAL